MGSRGRQSSKDKEIAVISYGGLEITKRPDPWPDLTDEQKSEWREIVNSLPADWFTKGTQATLAQLCRLITRARRLAQLIEKIEAQDEIDVKEYRDMIRSELETSKTIVSLSTKMRITQQSTYDKSKKKPRQMQNPWEG